MSDYLLASNDHVTIPGSALRGCFRPPSVRVVLHDPAWKTQAGKIGHMNLLLVKIHRECDSRDLIMGCLFTLLKKKTWWFKKKKNFAERTFSHICGKWLQIYAGNNNDVYRAGLLHAANLHKLKIHPAGKQILRKTFLWLADLIKNTRDPVLHLCFSLVDGDEPTRVVDFTSQTWGNYKKPRPSWWRTGCRVPATVSRQPSHLPSLSWSRNTQEDSGLLVSR